MPENPFLTAVQRLHNAAPHEFQEFVKEFDRYTMEATVAVTQADADGIMTAKGSALRCIALSRVFTDTIARAASPHAHRGVKP